MANKTISNFTTTGALLGTDQILLQRGSAYNKILGANLVSHLDTDDLTQGSTNLYASTTNLNSYLATKDSDDLSEGTTNKYATTSNLNTYLATKDSDDLSEGSTNLYATTSNLNTWLATKSLNDIDDGTTTVKIKIAKTDISAAQMLAAYSTPIKVITNTGGTHVVPFAAQLLVTGGSTPYTTTGNTFLDLRAGNTDGSTLSTQARMVADVTILGTASARAFGFVSNRYLLGYEEQIAGWNYFIRPDTANVTVGDLTYTIRVFYYEYEP